MKCFLVAAMSADGFIARSANDRSFDWTSSEDKQFYVETIKRTRAVIMGATTFKTFTKYPRGLRYVVYSSTPESFINPKPDVIQATATNQAPAEVLTQLAAEGFTEVAICGGSSIYTLFLQAGLVDHLYLTVEPVLFGRGVPLLSQAQDLKLSLVQVKNLSDQTVLLEYQLSK